MKIEYVTFVSDSELSREGIKRQISETGIEVAVASPATVLADPLWPDEYGHVIVVEAHDAGDGLDLCLALRERHELSRIVILSETMDEHVAIRGFQGGLNGFLGCSISFKVLICKLSLVCAGEKVLPSDMLTRLMEVKQPAPFDGDPIRLHSDMSARELGILRCLAEGAPNKVISRQLNIAEPTVKIHVKAILRKLHVANRTQAAVWAISHGAALSSGNAGIL